MKCLFDTSVLIAALVQLHPRHEVARGALYACRSGSRQGVIGAHSLAECYSTLSGYPVRPRIRPLEVRRMLEQGIIGSLEVVALDAGDYRRVIGQLADAGWQGGQVYDALLLECARKANCEQVLTFNFRDFRRLAPDLADRIVSP